MRPPPGGRAQREKVEFLSVVWALYRELHSASARMLEHLGVSGPQRLALRIVQINRRVTAGQLASAMDLHRSTVSGLVNRLERLGLLVRKSDPSDRRIVFLELTPAGRRWRGARRHLASRRRIRIIGIIRITGAVRTCAAVTEVA